MQRKQHWEQVFRTKGLPRSTAGLPSPTSCRGQRLLGTTRPVATSKQARGLSCKTSRTISPPGMNSNWSGMA